MKKILHINILGLILLTSCNSDSVYDTSSTTNNQNNIAEVKLFNSYLLIWEIILMFLRNSYRLSESLIKI
jgi:hypothetical protein